MRKAIVVVLFVALSALHAAAQNLKVTDFQLVPNDITASTPGTMRTDRNGERCAVIKIQTPERGFIFDCGNTGYSYLEEHPGETWLWVSPRLSSMAISHELFGKSVYQFTVPITGGLTYQMQVDIGIGRYVNIITTVPRAVVVVDGEAVGTSPVYNRYLSYGVHKIQAEKDGYEGTLTKVITEEDKPGTVLNVEMHDQSAHYGEVIVNVDGQADIYYNGQKVATGQWRQQLKEGTHTVETRRVDCDAQTTTFTVVAQQTNTVLAIAPVPHTGYLHLYVRPRNADVVVDGRQTVDHGEVLTLPVGSHELSFTRKGYKPLQTTYTLSHNQTIRDTVVMERIKYVRPVAFYFGGAYSLRTLSGATGIIGAVVKGHDVQASYTFGLAESDPVHWYSDQLGSPYLSSIAYKMQSLAVKYGYQIDLLRQLAITPQVGYSYDRLNGSVQRGRQMYADGATAHCLSLGLKLLVVPMQHVYLFAAPEFGIAVKKDPNFENISAVSNISAGGFTAHVGVLVSF